jgi:membrane protease YdiL (CAAX protease family)
MVELTPPYPPQSLGNHIQNGTIRSQTLYWLLPARTLLCFLAQASFAFAFWAGGNPEPWMAAVPYWNVFGTLVDLGCLLLLHHYLKKEGLSLLHLIRASRFPLWRDVLVGIGLFLLIFPTAIMGGTILSNLIVYGTFQPDLGEGVLIARQLPRWAMLYSLLVWWVIWSVTESVYYNGYLFPRLEALNGRTWTAILVVGAFWALQHVFFPFIPDARYIIWRFLQFLGIGLVMPWLFSRLRRLRPLIVSHWLMDFTGVLLTLRL